MKVRDFLLYMLQSVESGSIATLYWKNLYIYWQWYCLERNLRGYKTGYYLFYKMLEIPGVSRAETRGRNIRVDIDALRNSECHKDDDESLFSMSLENSSIFISE